MKIPFKLDIQLEYFRKVVIKRLKDNNIQIETPVQYLIEANS